MESNKLFPIFEEEVIKTNKMLQTSGESNTLNSSNYFKNITKNRLEQNTEDRKNEKGFLEYQNNIINQSPDKNSIDTRNSSINLIKKGNSNYLNKYDIIYKDYNNTDCYIYNQKHNEHINSLNNKNNILFNPIINLNFDNSEKKFILIFKIK